VKQPAENKKFSLGKLLQIFVNAVYLALLVAFLIGAIGNIAELFGKKMYFSSVINDHLTFSDFVLFYMCGKMALSADAHHVYEPAVQLKWFNQLLSLNLSRPFYAQYMPLVFLFWAPLALLPMAQAYIVWAFGSVLVTLSSMTMAIRAAGRTSAVRIGAVLLAIMGGFPAMLSLRMGQQAFLLVSFESWFVWGWFQKLDILSGAALACLSFKPHYCLFFAIPALVGRRWKLLIAAAVFEIILLIMAGMMIGWSNVLNYPAIVLYADNTGEYLGVNAPIMVSIRGLATVLLPQALAYRIGFIAMVLGMLTMAFVWRRTLVSGSKVAARFAICLTVVMCLVTSPHSHAYDLLMLGILAITLPNAPILSIFRLQPLSWRIWCIIVYLYPLWSWAAFMLCPLSISAPSIAFFLTNVALLVTGSSCLKLALKDESFFELVPEPPAPAA